jgi:hypothetical protein
MGLHKVIVFESARLQRLHGGVIFNDAKACYDCVIENISNIVLQQQGTPNHICKKHANTFQNIPYTIKYKLGLSNHTHQHNDTAPVYGVGQGACDAPARWGFVCDALINAYEQVANNAEIRSHISNRMANHTIAAFVDDTVLMNFIHKVLCTYILCFLQSDAQTWEKLLHTSGGKLEIPKCKFGVFEWK